MGTDFFAVGFVAGLILVGPIIAGCYAMDAYWTRRGAKDQARMQAAARRRTK